MLQMQRTVWDAGEAYEGYMAAGAGRSRDFIDWLALPVGGRWLDVGCGTGALTETILLRAEPASVMGIDSI